MDRFKGQFRIRVRCKTALSVPNENYQRFPVIPSFFPVARNEHSLSKLNYVTFAPSRLSLDSSTTAHYVVKTSKRYNNIDIASTTEAEAEADDDGYSESRMKTTKTTSSVANTPFFRKFSGQDTELETWDELEEEDSCFSSVSRTETKGQTAVHYNDSDNITTPTTPKANTSASNNTNQKVNIKVHEKNDSGSGSRSRFGSSVGSFKTKRSPLKVTNTLRNSASSRVESKHPFEEKSLEELEQLLRKYQQQQGQKQQSKSGKKKQASVENQAPHLENFHDGDGDNNLSDAAKFQSKLFERFSAQNTGKFPMTSSAYSSYPSSPLMMSGEVGATGDFFPSVCNKNQINSWTSVEAETELIFQQERSNPNPILGGRKFTFQGNLNSTGPFQRQLLERFPGKMQIPTKVGVCKPVLSDFPRPKFFQAPLRRLPTPWHQRPGTPLQKIYGSVVKHMPMDTETQRQKLIYQAVDNGHLYRRIKQATSIYKRKEQLTDFKKHEAFIKFRGPVANIQKRTGQNNNNNSNNSSDISQNHRDIQTVTVDSVSGQPSFSISISDIDADGQVSYEDEFEMDSNNEEGDLQP